MCEFRALSAAYIALPPPCSIFTPVTPCLKVEGELVKFDTVW